MIHAVQSMKVSVTQTPKKNRRPVHVTAKKTRLVDDVTLVAMASGIWTQIIRWVVRHARVICSVPLTIRAVINIPANVCVNGL